MFNILLQQDFIEILKGLQEIYHNCISAHPLHCQHVRIPIWSGIHCRSANGKHQLLLLAKLESFRSTLSSRQQGPSIVNEDTIIKFCSLEGSYWISIFTCGAYECLYNFSIFFYIDLCALHLGLRIMMVARVRH